MNKQAIIILITFFLAACSIKKELAENNISQAKSVKSLVTAIETNDNPPNILSLKGKINLEKDGQNLKFSTNVNIKKDSAIWISVKAPFGIELFRALIRTDSIYFLNIPKSTYTKAPISYLHQYLHTEIDFFQIQKMFFGTIPIPKRKYIFSENAHNYSLLGEKKNQNKIIFFIDKEDFRIVEASFYESENEYFKFEIKEYYKSEEGFLIPNNLKLEINTIDRFTVELNFTKIHCNKKQKIHFSIPENYVETK